MSSTHTESLTEGYCVVIQHCEADGCDEYLGVNYPTDFCRKHEPPPFSGKTTPCPTGQ